MIDVQVQGTCPLRFFISFLDFMQLLKHMTNLLMSVLLFLQEDASRKRRLDEDDDASQIELHQKKSKIEEHSSEKSSSSSLLLHPLSPPTYNGKHNRNGMSHININSH